MLVGLQGDHSLPRPYTAPCVPGSSGAQTREGPRDLGGLRVVREVAKCQLSTCLASTRAPDTFCGPRRHRGKQDLPALAELPSSLRDLPLKHPLVGHIGRAAMSPLLGWPLTWGACLELLAFAPATRPGPYCI